MRGKENFILSLHLLDKKNDKQGMYAYKTSQLYIIFLLCCRPTTYEHKWNELVYASKTIWNV